MSWLILNLMTGRAPGAVVPPTPVTKLSGIGDSIMDGVGAGSMVQYAAATLGVPYTVHGHSGYTMAALVTLFDTEVLPDAPSHAVLEGGVNDVNQGATAAAVVANWTAMLDKCVAADIIPVVVPILPWTNGTAAQNTTVDAINEQVLVLCASTYPTAIVADARSAVGQARAGGPEGNLWDIQTAYNSDGVHFTAGGEQAIGAVIAAALTP
jgi:lysophospholipase L1-like esterase